MLAATAPTRPLPTVVIEERQDWSDSSRIRQIGMEETLSELKKITEKGMALGVGEEEMIGVIRLCYKEGNND